MARRSTTERAGETIALWTAIVAVLTLHITFAALLGAAAVYLETRFSAVEEWQRTVCRRQQQILARQGLSRWADCPRPPQHGGDPSATP